MCSKDEEVWKEPVVIDIAAHVARIRQNGIAALAEIHGIERKELLGWSDQVVQDFGRVFKGNKALVMDEELLPFAKQDIQVALKLQFYQFALRREEQAMADIARAYLQLSRFQAIDQRDKPMLDELNRGTAPPLDVILKEKQELTAEEAQYQQNFETFHAYLGRIENEKDDLGRDFSAFVQSLVK